MSFSDEIVVLIARERMRDAVHHAALRRALREARPRRRPVRVHLGEALIRLGHWLQGPAPAPPGAWIDPGKGESSLSPWVDG